MINVEYKDSGFDIFLHRVKGKFLTLIFDVNTEKYARRFESILLQNGTMYNEVLFSDEEPVPDEKAVKTILDNAQKSDYILAVGSGTLNDLAKATSTTLGIACGVLCTAPSMDGYCSKGAALMRNGRKVTDSVHMPVDVLIDFDIVCHAPKLMVAAGFGDIMGKFTCLTDWKFSHILNGEDINDKAYRMMEKALRDCYDTFEDLKDDNPNAVKNLMDALICAGLSMAECGNSRPASGSEHHISHYLEMWFVAQGKKVPLHGIKVGLGTLVSLEIYNYIKESNVEIEKKEEVYKIIDALPKIETIKKMLFEMGAPIRFSELGISKELFEETMLNAYKIRDRFTVLTYVCRNGIMKNILPVLVDKYY